MSNKSGTRLDEASDFNFIESSQAGPLPSTHGENNNSDPNQTRELSGSLLPREATEIPQNSSSKNENATNLSRSSNIANEMEDSDTNIDNEQVSVTTFTIGSVSTLIMMLQTLDNDDENTIKSLLENGEEVKEKCNDVKVQTEIPLDFNKNNDHTANKLLGSSNGVKNQTMKKESVDLISPEQHKLRKNMYCIAVSQFLYIVLLGAIYYVSHQMSTITAESLSMEVILYILIAISQVARCYYAYILYIAAKKESISVTALAANYCPWMWLYHACVCIWGFINFILLKASIWNILISVYLAVQLVSSCAFYVQEEKIIGSYKDVLIKRIFRTFTHSRSQSTDF